MKKTGRWRCDHLRREWARTQQRERLENCQRKSYWPQQFVETWVTVQKSNDYIETFFQKISHERNCSSSSRPMWQPDWRQVLGDHLRWARCRPDWNLPWRFRLTTRTSQRLLQWGLWWKIRSPCCSRRSWTRHYGLRSVRTLRTGNLFKIQFFSSNH